MIWTVLVESITSKYTNLNQTFKNNSKYIIGSNSTLWVIHRSGCTTDSSRYYFQSEFLILSISIKLTFHSDRFIYQFSTNCPILSTKFPLFSKMWDLVSAAKSVDFIHDHLRRCIHSSNMNHPFSEPVHHWRLWQHLVTFPSGWVCLPFAKH